MTEVIERHRLQAENTEKQGQSSSEMQSGASTYAKLSKEIGEKTLNLRQMEGEELEGLSFEELIKLERQVEKGRTRIRQIKGENLRKVISSLKGKEALLVHQNARLKEQMNGMSREHASLLKLCTSSESMNNNRRAVEPPLRDSVVSDASLRLGL
ncbi:hypothetical protein Ancab_017381 [Ancistrocladus abbreviatus]